MTACSEVVVYSPTMVRARSKRAIAAAGIFSVCAIVSLLLGGCGRGSSAAANATQRSAIVTARSSNNLGDYLVGGNGHTLYMFTSDKDGNSACYGQCARKWPPLLTHGKPRAGGGIPGGELGTITRKDGSTQVTCNGHPLYYFAADGKPGDDKGEALTQFGGKWYALTPLGERID